MPTKRAPWSRALVLALLAGSLLESPAARLGADEAEAELLLPGQCRERHITADETHAYRIEVPDAPVLVTVEQRGIDLVIGMQGPAEHGELTTDAPNGSWGAEVVLLHPGVAGGHRLAVRSGQKLVPSGAYLVRAEALSPAQDAGSRRTSALAAMSRGGQLAPGGPEAQPRAADAYREALEIWRALGEKRWIAETLQILATLEYNAGNARASTASSEEALALWQELSEPRREASALQLVGESRLRAGESEAAREALGKALALWQKLGQRLDEGRARSVLCLLEQTSGVLPAALACYEEVRALYHEIGYGAQEATILNNLGGLYELLGEPDAALAHHEQVLALSRQLGDPAREANSLINIAAVRRFLGEWQEALRLYAQARELLEPLGNRSEIGKLLNNIGYAYNSLGEPQRALSFLQDALRLRREIGDRRGEVITLNNLGLTWRKLGDPDQALGLHRQALALARSLGDSRQEATSRRNLGEAQLERGDPVAALHELEQPLALFRQIGSRRGELETLQLRGRALTLAGRAGEAIPVFQEVLAGRRALRDRAGETESLHALATAERSLGRLGQALAHAEDAVNRLEDLRTGLVSPDLRASFLATRHRAYALMIDLLMDRHAADPRAGYDRTALDVSERARARGLIDALQAGAHRRAGTTVPAGLVERRLSLHHRLTAKADQHLRQSRGTGDTKAEVRIREIETLLAELDGVEAEIRRHDPQYAAFSRPQPIGAERIAGLLEPGTLLLEYALGDERSVLWAVGAGSFRSFLLPSQREIEVLVRRLYEDLSTVEAGAGRHEKAATALARVLLGPVWSEAAGLHRLVVVPDAALQILPFAALRVPPPGQSLDGPGVWEPLLEHLEVVYLPSATTLALQRQRLSRRVPASRSAVVLADPVFSADDPRLAEPSAGPGRASTTAASLLPAFERLPASRSEAEMIARLAPAGQVWTVLDLAASRETALSGQLRDYRIVHFATHGIADTRNPELSGLVLSLVDAAGRPREGFFGLSDITELDLGADLVVLSGCRTALGKEVRGEGLMGLTHGFQYAGVPRVVAGLWRVQDRTTAELMARFYRALWQDRLSPAAALREAQRSLHRQPRYRHPYSWAGFVLQGDWR